MASQGEVLGRGQDDRKARAAQPHAPASHLPI